MWWGLICDHAPSLSPPLLSSAAKCLQHWYRELRREKWTQIHAWSTEWGRFEEQKRTELVACATEATKLQKGARALAAIIVPQVPSALKVPY